MKNITLLTAGLAAFILVGCANDQHVYYQGKCLSCMNNPMTGEPVNYDPDTLPAGAMDSSRPVASRTSGADAGMATLPGVSERDELRMSYSGDVDSAAALLKNAFGYLTPQEAVAQHGTMAGGMMFNGGGYTFSAVPSTTYSMTRVYFDGSLTTLVSKGKSGADVLLTYSVYGRNEGPSVPAVMQRVERVANDALR